MPEARLGSMGRGAVAWTGGFLDAAMAPVHTFLPHRGHINEATALQVVIAFPFVTSRASRTGANVTENVNGRWARSVQQAMRC
jgi:hypothetical protein